MNQEKILLAALLIIFLAETALSTAQTTKNGDIWQGTCSCQCKNVELKAAVAYKTAYAEQADSASANTIKFCHEQCAKSCGGYTDCSSDDKNTCAKCCQGYCSPFDATVINKCELSCSSTCSYKGVVNGIIEIIYVVAGIVGALMIVINGLRLTTSQDPGERNAAKNGIIYVIIAILIIVMAATLVNLFMNSATIPQT